MESSLYILSVKRPYDDLMMRMCISEIMNGPCRLLLISIPNIFAAIVFNRFRVRPSKPMAKP